jgi:hypothetical protein
MNKLSLLFSLLLLLTATTVYCQKYKVQGEVVRFYTPLTKPLFIPFLNTSQYKTDNLFFSRNLNSEGSFLFIMPPDYINCRMQPIVINATNFLPNSNNVLENLVQVAGLIVLDKLFLEKPLRLKK